MGNIAKLSWEDIGGLAACVTVGLFLYAGFRRFVNARNRTPNAMHLAVAMGIYIAAALGLAGLSLPAIVSQSNYVSIIKWSQGLSIVSQFALIWFIAFRTRVWPKVLLAALSSAFLLGLSLHIFSFAGLFLSYMQEATLVELPWGARLIHPRALLNPWRAPVDLPGLVLLGYLAGACAAAYRRGARRAALVTLAAGSLAMLANLHDMFVLTSVFFAPHGLLVMAGVAGLDLRKQIISERQARCNASPKSEALAQPSESAPQDSGHFMPGAGTPPPPLLWVQHPVLGTLLAVLLILVAQCVGSERLVSIVVSLALLAMMQATIGVLYGVGSGRWVRGLAVFALCLMALSQLTAVVESSAGFSLSAVIPGRLPSFDFLREFLLVAGLLLLLNAFYLAGLEGGEARRILALEHAQLLTEIAERNRAENEVRHREERFRAFVENAMDTISVLNEEGRLIYVSPSVKQVLGYDVEGVLGMRLFDLLHPDDLPLAMNIFGRMRDGELLTGRASYRIRHRDGAWRHMEAFGKNLLGDPVVRGIVVNSRDVTDRKLMESRLQEIREEERTRIRRDLHDAVGQDLTGLLCMAGSMAKRLQPLSLEESHQAESFVEAVRLTMREVQAVVRGIAPVEAEPSGLQHALDRLVRAAQEQTETGIRFECPKPVLLEQNDTATHLFRIAQEGLANALKHARARCVTLSLQQERQSIVLRIVDDGKGMGNPVGSDGMGLRTMRSRAAAMGANLTVDSPQAEGGTRIECAVPHGTYHSKEEI